MVVRRRKKSRKLRGRTRTMGWGRIGQHRKSGARGGFGLVGFHKHKWTWTVKHAPFWFGKHGFTQPPPIVAEIRGVNVGELDEIARDMVRKGIAVMDGEKIVVDVVALGFNKVLGGGKVTQPLKVITPAITEKARLKIEEAGGEVILKK